MSLTRAALVRGPAVVTWNGIKMYTRDDVMPRHAPVWDNVMTSMYGEVDKVKKDLVIKIPVRLWGAWESLSVLFPSGYLNPTIGASVFGTTDLPLVILGRNGDRVTYHNVQLTKMADLRLGVDQDMFSADVEFTALLKNSANPEDDAAYYTVAIAQAYADDTFAKTNFKRVRFAGAWGAKTGWTTIAPQDGFNVSWGLNLAAVTVDGLGTVDMTLTGMVATARCIPIGPTLAQIETEAKLGGTGSGNGAAHGTLLSANAADLTMTGSGVSVVLKNAALTESGYLFGAEKLRFGEVGWATTRGFAAGVPAAVSTVG